MFAAGVNQFRDQPSAGGNDDGTVAALHQFPRHFQGAALDPAAIQRRQ